MKLILLLINNYKSQNLRGDVYGIPAYSLFNYKISSTPTTSSRYSTSASSGYTTSSSYSTSTSSSYTISSSYSTSTSSSYTTSPTSYSIPSTYTTPKITTNTVSSTKPYGYTTKTTSETKSQYSIPTGLIKNDIQRSNIIGIRKPKSEEIGEAEVFSIDKICQAGSTPRECKSKGMIPIEEFCTLNPRHRVCRSKSNMKITHTQHREELAVRAYRIRQDEYTFEKHCKVVPESSECLQMYKSCLAKSFQNKECQSFKVDCRRTSSHPYCKKEPVDCNAFPSHQDCKPDCLKNPVHPLCRSKGRSMEDSPDSKTDQPIENNKSIDKKEKVASLEERMKNTSIQPQPQPQEPIKTSLKPESPTIIDSPTNNSETKSEKETATENSKNLESKLEKETAIDNSKNPESKPEKEIVVDSPKNLESKLEKEIAIDNSKNPESKPEKEIVVDNPKNLESNPEKEIVIDNSKNPELEKEKISENKRDEVEASPEKINPTPVDTPNILASKVENENKITINESSKSIDCQKTPNDPSCSKEQIDCKENPHHSQCFIKQTKFDMNLPEGI